MFCYIKIYIIHIYLIFFHESLIYGILRIHFHEST